MFSALGARALAGLRLNYERPELSPLAQEIRRRLVWSFTMIDGHFSVGLPEFELCPYEVVQLQLPCNEKAFESENMAEPQREDSSANGTSSSLGMLACCIGLARIRRDIMKFTRSLARRLQSVPELVSRVEAFQQNLQSMEADMGHWPYTQERLKNMLGTRWFSHYLMLHLSWAPMSL